METKKSTWIVILNNKNEILFLKRKSWKWTLPWWKLEKSESFLDCAKRELFEETGLKNIELRLFMEKTTQRWSIFWDEKIYIWNLEKNIKLEVTEPDIFEKIVFLPIDNLPEFEYIEDYDWEILDKLKEELWFTI